MGISIDIRFVYGYYDPTGEATGLPVTGWDEEGPYGCVVDPLVP